jgi:hypothetical protein
MSAFGGKADMSSSVFLQRKLIAAPHFTGGEQATRECYTLAKTMVHGLLVLMT